MRQFRDEKRPGNDPDPFSDPKPVFKTFAEREAEKEQDPPIIRRVLQSGGGRIRTDDLEVMSLASYRAAPPRVILDILIKESHFRLRRERLSLHQSQK